MRIDAVVPGVAALRLVYVPVICSIASVVSCTTMACRSPDIVLRRLSREETGTIMKEKNTTTRVQASRYTPFALKHPGMRGGHRHDASDGHEAAGRIRHKKRPR